jgi:transketolase
MTSKASSTAALAGGIRRIVIEQSKRAHVGHIGSALSIADLLAVLYGGQLRHDGNDRDRFILSKGHAALALYAALELVGRLNAGTVEAYCADGTLLGVHPEVDLPGVDFATGSLGHGLSMGVGAALAARTQHSRRRSFVLLSDAELNEGSVWEAAMFAAHHRLSNLVALVDVNRQQALGYTADVLDLEPVADRWRAFGWDVREVDGHDHDALARTLQGLDTTTGQPHVVLARTTFGKGVSYMERRIEWHYLPMSDEQYLQAVEELRGAGGDGEIG